jgi:hypothetical protein
MFFSWGVGWQNAHPEQLQAFVTQQRHPGERD